MLLYKIKNLLSHVSTSAVIYRRSAWHQIEGRWLDRRRVPRARPAERPCGEREACHHKWGTSSVCQVEGRGWARINLTSTLDSRVDDPSNGILRELHQQTHEHISYHNKSAPLCYNMFVVISGMCWLIGTNLVIHFKLWLVSCYKIVTCIYVHVPEHAMQFSKHNL